jgi:hypothetical protein
LIDNPTFRVPLSLSGDTLPAPRGGFIWEILVEFDSEVTHRIVADQVYLTRPAADLALGRYMDEVESVIFQSFASSGVRVLRKPRLSVVTTPDPQK